MAVARNLLLVTAIFATLFYTGVRERVPGPRDPISADGSLTAGRALTIVDQEPAPQQSQSNLDDPVKFRERFSSSAVERNRDVVLGFAGLAGPALCENDQRTQLIVAIRRYYGTKKYLLNEFHFRGPRATQFIDEALRSPNDLRIDALVQQWLDAGYVRAREIWPRDRSFVFDVLAQEFRSNACSRS